MPRALLDTPSCPGEASHSTVICYHLIPKTVSPWVPNHTAGPSHLRTGMGLEICWGRARPGPLGRLGSRELQGAAGSC